MGLRQYHPEFKKENRDSAHYVNSKLFFDIVRTFRDAAYDFLFDNNIIELPNRVGYMYISKTKNKHKFKFIPRLFKHPFNFHTVFLNNSKDKRYKKYVELYG